MNVCLFVGADNHFGSKPGIECITRRLAAFGRKCPTQRGYAITGCTMVNTNAANMIAKVSQ